MNGLQDPAVNAGAGRKSSASSPMDSGTDGLRIVLYAGAAGPASHLMHRRASYARGRTRLDRSFQGYEPSLFEVDTMLGKLQAVADRVLYVLLPAIFISLIPIGLIYGMPWLGIAVGAIVVPVADELIGKKQGTLTGPTSAAARVLLVTFLLAMIWSLVRVSGAESWSAVVLAGLSSGYVLGAIGIAAAHELGHRLHWADLALGQSLLACMGYGHYQTAHNRHHSRAGLFEDPATARREESLWGFFPRYLVGIWKDAADASANASVWHRRHRPFVLLTGTAIATGLIAILLGPRSLVLWVSQGVMGLFLIGSVDYIQHWGLRRRMLKNGQYERASAAHTWESPFYLSERITLNLTRHNHHHLWPAKDATALERIPEGPQMPYSYGVMVTVAIIPPMFRKIMEPRLDHAVEAAPTEPTST